MVVSSVVEHFPYKERVTGSNPVLPISQLGGIGRHDRLKIYFHIWSIGSIPIVGNI